MAGRSVSGYVDEAVVERLGTLARIEDRTPANLMGQALGFYVTLPESARTALRRIEQLGTPEERRWCLGELTRALLKADMALTQRLMATEMSDVMSDIASEDDVEAQSLEWTRPKRS